MAEEKVTTMFEVVDQWAASNVQALKTQILKRGIYVTGWLRTSLAYNIVTASDGNVEKAQIMFAMYGRFVDMGVGRGMPIGSRQKLGASIYERARNMKGQLHKYNRKPKKWYSRPMAGGVHSLREILAFHFGTAAVSTVEEGLRNSKIQLTL